MADMTIDEAAADTTITGGEKIPVSDGGVAKSVTVSQICSFVAEAIAGSESVTGITVDEDGIYVSVDGETKILPAEKLAKAVIDYGCALAGIVGPNGNEIFIIDDSGTKKTITLDQVKNYITSNAAGFFSSLSNAGTMAASDKVMVKQGANVTVGTLGNLAAFALSTFASFIGECVNVLNVQTTDKIAVVSGGVTKWMSVAQLSSALETGLTVPSTTTAGNVPTYSNTSGGLGTGLAVQTTVRAQGTAGNDSLATEAAVRAAIESATSGQGTGDVKGPSSTTQGKLPTWDSTQKKLTDGKSVVTEVGATGVDSAIPTEKAVRTAIAAEASARSTAISNATEGAVKGPGSTTENKIPQWDSTTRKLKDGLALTQTIDSNSTASQVPSAAAVKAAVDAKVGKRGTPIASKLARWYDPSTVEEGPSVSTSVGMTGSDSAVPTEKAVRTAINAAIESVGSPSDTWCDEIFIPAAAMVPGKTNGATAATTEFGNVKRDTMSFGTTNDDTCEFDLVLPDDWNKGGVRAKLLWTSSGSSAAASTNVKWGIGCVVSADGGALNSVPDNFAVVSDELSAVSAFQRSGASASFTPEGTAGDGNLLHFTVKRMNSNAPSSPLADAALLLGVVIQFKRSHTTEEWT